ncbi:DUF3037 domain-containing protein [Edaphobacter sp. 12200R-103]|uniref:DUF3037 domain-containing protein n=1 Tax=Edaphobacter sp. 12200R-103 TaxID=2703788 RepID=UPI00138D61A0|nr:DUF3037 domain-containing protein [Edaphobacter sp. 12200R-103]QHS52743.1 DUF3037 domain-containing protein [Edaphobacter sp. 12200R-103]
MADRVPCEFFLIRYVPDVVKGEFTNIGVVLRPAGAEAADAVVRFTRDWSRVRCMDADADLGVLEALEGEIAERLRLGAADTKPVLTLLEDTLSNSVQISEPRASLAENMAAEMEQLLRMYVEPLRGKQERRKSGRAAIVSSMRNEFERAGVWGMMRKRIAASLYTRAGDPMKIDCGYRADAAGAAGSLIRMFQAVSLEGDVEAAKGFAYSAPQLREGVERVERARLELTAVVEPLRMSEDGADEAVERYRFGVEAMEREAIRVVTLSDLARVAETARLELRV